MFMILVLYLSDALVPLLNNIDPLTPDDEAFANRTLRGTHYNDSGLHEQNYTQEQLQQPFSQRLRCRRSRQPVNIFFPRQYLSCYASSPSSSSPVIGARSPSCCLTLKASESS